MTPLVLGRTLINTDEVLGTYNGHLMSQSEQLKLQRSTPTKAEGEQRSEGGMICDHADKGMASTRKSLGFLHVSEF